VNKTGYNSTYKKLAVQWLNEALCFVSSSVVADSFVIRNRQLLVAAKTLCLIVERHRNNITEHRSGGRRIFGAQNAAV
jgi:hypothetical protein